MENPKDGLSEGGQSPNVSSEGKAGVADRRSDIFFAAIETTRMPMILTDPNQPDNPIVFANHAFLAMTGYTSHEIVGRNCRFLQGPETDYETVAGIRQSLENKERVAVEILNYRKDGSSFWNALFISPVYNNDGRLVYFFASQLDVSRRRDAEAALLQSQKMEAVGQLTGGIAHDFNNLLQVISGSLELFRISMAAEAGSRNERLLKTMEEASTRAKTLTQQLLAFSRKQKLEGRVVNVNNVIEEMGDIFARSVSGALNFEYALDDALCNARLDASQLQMALLNVVINARDAMPDGGTVTIKTENLKINEEDQQLFEGLMPGEYIAVMVTDTGTGMPKEILKRVMDPFFTTKEEGKGTGLGLSMVYGYAKQSGGAARIYSEEGIGTTVKLLFPATDRPVNPMQQKQVSSSARGGTERILIVDDRADVAEMASMMLEAAGYRTVIAGDGHSALKLLTNDPDIDMMFTDIVMPGSLNGVSLSRMALVRKPKLKILLTTGFAETSSSGAIESDLEFPMISKPYTQTDLLKKVRIVLNGPDGVS